MKYIHNYKKFSLLNESTQVQEIDEDQYANETVPALPFNEEIKGEKEEFLKKLTFIAKKLGVKPEWLMIAINGESGFNPKAVNSNGGATGLIQFMPSTIKNYLHPETNQQMTTSDLLKMNAVDQLDVVYSYLKESKKSVGFQENEEFKTPGDFFALIFYPKVIKEPDNYQFPDNIVSNNKGLFQRMGGITKKDYYNYCDRLVKDPSGVAKSISNFDIDGYFGSGSGADDSLFKDILTSTGLDKVVKDVFFKSVEDATK